MRTEPSQRSHERELVVEVGLHDLDAILDARRGSGSSRRCAAPGRGPRSPRRPATPRAASRPGRRCPVMSARRRRTERCYWCSTRMYCHASTRPRGRRIASATDVDRQSERRRDEAAGDQVCETERGDDQRRNSSAVRARPNAVSASIRLETAAISDDDHEERRKRQRDHEPAQAERCAQRERERDVDREHADGERHEHLRLLEHEQQRKRHGERDCPDDPRREVRRSGGRGRARRSRSTRRRGRS